MRDMRSGGSTPKKRHNTIILAAVVVFALVMMFVPRWRRAALCTLTGGRWTASDSQLVATECRMKSRTAGKQCTGQLRDECDRSLCDLAVKAETAGGGRAAGGTCPAYWVRNFYDKDGAFFRKN